jgi:hypothetical protein
VTASADEPPLMVALIPPVMVLLVNLAMTWWIIPAMDLAYLEDAKFGHPTVNDVRGIWALVASLSLAILSASCCTGRAGAILLVALCRLTHRESYLDIFVVSVAFPLIALTVVLVLGSTFGSF